MTSKVILKVIVFYLGMSRSL